MSKIETCDVCSGSGMEIMFGNEIMGCSMCCGEGHIEIEDGIERAIKRLEDVREDASNNQA